MGGGEVAHEAPDEAPHPCEVLPEHGKHLFVADRLRAGVAHHSGVVVGHERDPGEAHAEFGRQRGLGHLRHVHHVAAERAEPRRLGAGRKARALDDHDRAAVVHADAFGAGRGDSRAP